MSIYNSYLVKIDWILLSNKNSFRKAQLILGLNCLMRVFLLMRERLPFWIKITSILKMLMFMRFLWIRRWSSPNLNMRLF